MKRYLFSQYSANSTNRKDGSHYPKDIHIYPVALPIQNTVDNPTILQVTWKNLLMQLLQLSSEYTV